MMGMIDPAFMEKLYDIVLNDKDTSSILHELDTYEPEQVIDEMVIYLKQRLLAKDLKFDIYLFDRYFRILGDAKQLLSLNSDGGFVLILTLSKLSEAKKLKTIDEIIQEVEKIPTIEQKQTVSTPTPKEQIPTYETLYVKVIEKVYDRNYELGVCFEKSFKYSSYENNILTINSDTTKECKTFLYQHFSYIKTFIEEIYGKDTVMKFNKISNEEPKTTSSELNVENIVNSKMVKKAQELFQPTNQITVQVKN
jgi:DNA polymerase-3 subunit gamma/tau